MGKSAGNASDPLELAEKYGVDQLRYFLLREVSFGQDGTYSEEAIVTRCNAELANSFGNLAQRVLSLIVKNCDRYLPAISGHDDQDSALFELVGQAVSRDIPEAFTELALGRGVETWMNAVFACNAYVDAQAPWALRKTDIPRMETVLATLYICIAQLAVAIHPIIPDATSMLLDTMGLDGPLRTYEGVQTHWYSPLAESDYRLAPPTPIFPRLEMPSEAD